MSESPWQFWIDVGGTFTDCFAHAPNGSLRSKKVLSSGVTKGTVADGSTENRIVDPRRDPDPRGVWQGYRLRVLGEQGEVLGERLGRGLPPCLESARHQGVQRAPSEGRDCRQAAGS